MAIPYVNEMEEENVSLAYKQVASVRYEPGILNEGEVVVVFADGTSLIVNGDRLGWRVEDPA